MKDYLIPEADRDKPIGMIISSAVENMLDEKFIEKLKKEELDDRCYYYAIGFVVFRFHSEHAWMVNFDYDWWPYTNGAPVRIQPNSYQNVSGKYKQYLKYWEDKDKTQWKCLLYKGEKKEILISKPVF